MEIARGHRSPGLVKERKIVQAQRKVSEQYVVIRVWSTRSGKSRAISAGPFSSRNRAKTYMNKFLREEWYLPRSEFFIAPLRPTEEQLTTWHERGED